MSKKTAIHTDSGFLLPFHFFGEGVVDHLVKIGGLGEFSRLGHHGLQAIKTLLAHHGIGIPRIDGTIGSHRSGEQLQRGIGEERGHRLRHLGVGMGGHPLLPLIYRIGEALNQVGVFLDITLFGEICKCEYAYAEIFLSS